MSKIIEQREIPLAELEIDPHNVRTAMADIGELEDSIEEHGVIQPIIVRRVDEKFYVVAGGLRVQASKSVGLKTIPAVIKELTDEEAKIESLIENIHRGDLDPDDEATAIADLYSIYKSERKVADAINKPKTYVHDQLKAKGIIDLFTEVKGGRHADHPVLPKDERKVRVIGDTGQAVFPEEPKKQVELFEALKDKPRQDVKRASTYIRAKMEMEPEVFTKKPVEEIVKDAFKVVNVDVSLRFDSKVSKGIIKCAEEREISWEDVVEIALEQWLKDGGYLD
ncbi:MAG: ParB/RepB/Spo0J family partition protein [Thermoplasmata archaeon]|nr:ParB/RepB/Spo0J family partition protein [Thermoplasmata archaeon]